MLFGYFRLVVTLRKILFSCIHLLNIRGERWLGSGIRSYETLKLPYKCTYYLHKRSGLLLLLFPILLTGQQPFVCDGSFYLSLSIDREETTFFKVNIGQDSLDIRFEALGEAYSGASLNAIGYNGVDNFIYGINKGTFELFKVDRTGKAFLVGKPQGDYDISKGHLAGDVTLDGRYLVIVETFNVDESLLFIDLESSDLRVTKMPLSGLGVKSADIAFDPTTGTLYGFDRLARRLVTYDINTGVVVSSFPTTSITDLMGALFFNADGQLFAYGRGDEGGSDLQNAFFSIDINTGLVKLEGIGPVASQNDGCSCPYNVKLTAYGPEESVPACTEIPFTIEINNFSKTQQENLELRQDFPDGFTITAIEHSLAVNTIQDGGIGSNFITFSDFPLPIGRHKIQLTVALPPNTFGDYTFQAMLSGLPENLGHQIFSDNPFTLQVNDPYILQIVPLAVDFSTSERVLCRGEQLTFDAYFPGADYVWNDGSTDSKLVVVEDGFYSVTVTTGCEQSIDTFKVIERSLNINLSEEWEINLGDSITLQPEIKLNGALLFWSWSSESVAIACPTCRELTVAPLDNTNYNLTVQNGEGCKDSVTVLVMVNKNRAVFFPNIFSPNNDGLNDVFFPQSKEDLKVISFQVFDRWGNLVFQNEAFMTNQESEGWNGQHPNDEPSLAGSYLFQAFIVYPDGLQKRFVGSLALLR